MAGCAARARQRSWPESPAATMTDGLEVLVQEVIAAMATLPWSTTWSCAVQGDVTAWRAGPAALLA